MTPPRPTRAACFTLLVACLLPVSFARGEEPSAESAPATATDPTQFDAGHVEFFEKKVRPLLVARCHKCHGAKEQKGNLRLDSRASALKGGDTAPAVVPGKPEDSLLVDAVRYGDIYQMPPKSQLPQEDVDTLVEWVRLGAPWGAETAAAAASKAEFDLQARAGHWCFQPLSAAAPPQVADSSWIRTPVDRFILARLEAAGIAPAPLADKRTLLRRVTFDLIGLPPTPQEIEAFLADDSDTAYQTVVESLLASPHYGERWARHWLDLVRYAETHGHEFDFPIPNAYRYRDYVIRAFNADLPFDRFVTEHVAGDLLNPPRTNPQEGFNESILGTGWFFFHEAKHSPVDARRDEADRIDNQIDVFAKAFLGLTVSCARCHDHKFDAISTRDYYALAGYLQSSRYQQAIIDGPDSRGPAIARLTEYANWMRKHCRKFAREEILPRVDRIAAALPTISTTDVKRASQHSWDVLYPWAVLSQPSAAATAPEADFAARRVALVEQLRTQRAAAQAADVLADFTSGTFNDWQPAGEAFGPRPGLPLERAFVGPGGRFPGQMLVAPAIHSGLVSPSLQGSIRSPTFEIKHTKLWYRVYGDGGRVRLILDGLQLIRNPIYGGLEFKPDKHEPYWHEQDVSKWVGRRAYIEVLDDGDGYVALEQVASSNAGPPPEAPDALIVDMLDDATLTSPAQLAAKYAATCRQALSDWLSAPEVDGPRTADRAALVAWTLEQPALDPDGLKEAEAILKTDAAAYFDQRHTLEAALPAPRRALAMVDGTAENEHIFIRGNHKTLGDEVPRRFLEVLGGTAVAPPERGSGRLELAEQLVANPLLPRVIVNRLWHHHFGAGIVRSPDDFGAMGQPPTHPELLDYLARELIAGGWSLKHVHRRIVLSNTYRMSSEPVPAADSADPQNKLWHRREVRRLEAEAIRDAILQVSTRADFRMYGPGVMPYLTEFMAGRGRPATSGPLDGNGRRSIYLAVRRNFLPPMFLAFDYPTPFTTIGRRGLSNVPAQALAMMNNPFVVGQAHYWAAALQSDKAQTPDQRVRQMYVTALSRPPDDQELAAALAFVDAASAESSPGQAWADLAHVLFNVKEFIFIR